MMIRFPARRCVAVGAFLTLLFGLWPGWSARATRAAQQITLTVGDFYPVNTTSG